MRRTRLLLAAMPRMLRDIIRDTVLPEPDLEVAGEVEDPAQLDAAVAATDAEVVVLALPAGRLPETLHPFLYRHPRVRLLSVSGDGRHASLHRLLPHARVVADVSPRGLLEAIRQTGVEPAADGTWGG